jgi:hypothetical protein
VYFSIEVNSPNSLFAQFFWPALPVNKDPTVWLDIARHLYPTPLLGKFTCADARHIHPKNTFARITKLVKFGGITVINGKKNLTNHF